MPKVQTRERSFRLPDGQFESDVPNVQGGQIKSSSQSPIARKENNMEVDSLERRFEMQKRDEEFYAKIATSPMVRMFRVSYVFWTDRRSGLHKLNVPHAHGLSRTS
jgi:hypothetical protein